VAAAVSLEEVLEQLLADYTLLRPSVRIRAVFGASDELADQILEGAPADLFLSANPHQLERLGNLEVIDPQTTTPLAENALAAIGPLDSMSSVRRPTDLAGPGVSRLALAVPSSPLGSYTLAYLKGLGMHDALMPRAVVVENAGAVAAAVRAGQADVGLAYASSAGASSGCKVLFRVPRATVAIRYAGALLRRGRQSDARGLLEYLASGQALKRFRRCGFLPVHD
jgi:molybdate transport system substrate-binding protein